MISTPSTRYDRKLNSLGSSQDKEADVGGSSFGNLRAHSSLDIGEDFCTCDKLLLECDLPHQIILSDMEPDGIKIVEGFRGKEDLPTGFRDLAVAARFQRLSPLDSPAIIELVIP